MGDGTKIEWCDMSWNMLRVRNKATGSTKGHFCIKVAPECKNCYAEAFQPRLGNPVRYAAQDLQLVEPYLDEKALLDPLRKQRPRLIFPCSMTDLFAEFYPDDWIDKVMAIAALTPRHTYQVLTKRGERMVRYFTHWPQGMGRQHHVFHEVHMLLNKMAGKTGWNSNDKEFKRAQEALAVWPLPNWHQGVSAGTQEQADLLIPALLKVPAARRWVSAEPLLERIDLSEYLARDMRIGTKAGTIPEPSLDSVVIGGESGPGARPLNVDWVRDLVQQCRAAGVPPFVKQLGRYVVHNGISRPGGHWPTGTKRQDMGTGVFRVLLKAFKGGDMAEWPEDLRVREMPANGGAL